MKIKYCRIEIIFFDIVKKIRQYFKIKQTIVIINNSLSYE